MRTEKRNRRGGGPRRLQSETTQSQLHQARAAADEILPSVSSVNSQADAERILVDRFGHRHSRRVLTLWPDRVRTAMGVRFLDKSELTEAGHARQT